MSIATIFSNIGPSNTESVTALLNNRPAQGPRMERPATRSAGFDSVFQAAAAFRASNTRNHA